MPRMKSKRHSVSSDHRVGGPFRSYPSTSAISDGATGDAGGGAVRPRATATPIVAAITPTSYTASVSSGRLFPVSRAGTDFRRWTYPNPPSRISSTALSSTSRP